MLNFWNFLKKLGVIAYKGIDKGYDILYPILIPALACFGSLILLAIDNGQFHEVMSIYIDDLSNLDNVRLVFLYHFCLVFFMSFVYIYFLSFGEKLIASYRNNKLKNFERKDKTSQLEYDELDNRYNNSLRILPYGIIIHLIGGILCVMHNRLELFRITTSIAFAMGAIIALALDNYKKQNRKNLLTRFYPFNEGIINLSYYFIVLTLILPFLMFYLPEDSLPMILIISLVSFIPIYILTEYKILPGRVTEYFFLLSLILLMINTSPIISYFVMGMTFSSILIFELNLITISKSISGIFFLFLIILVVTATRSGLVKYTNLQAANAIEVFEGSEDDLNRQSVNQDYRQWLKFKKQENSIQDSSILYILASEGGGIRSAIWTTAVYGKLDSLFPNMINNTYALSGVSGGSVGSAVFAALKKDQFGDMQNSYKKIYSGDLLSNTILATMVGFPFQTIWPFPISNFDRSRILENDLAHSYMSGTGSNTLSNGLLELYKNDNHSIPNLFLNSTHVESGKKCIISNLKLDTFFGNDLDLFKTIHSDIPMTTSAILSARFPIVSSSGLVYDEDGDVWGNLVDGGFYDNSGLLTAIDLVKMIRNAPPDSMYIKPVIIFVRNGNDQYEGKGNKGFAPANALVNSWAANTERRINDLMEIRPLLDFELIQFKLDHSDYGEEGYPLGWIYSKQTRDKLFKTANKFGEDLDNEIHQFNLDQLNELRRLQSLYN